MSAMRTGAITTPSQTNPVAPSSGSWLKWGVAIVVLLILFQFKPARPYVLGLTAIVALGMVLANYGKVSSQFKAIGA